MTKDSRGIITFPTSRNRLGGAPFPPTDAMSGNRSTLTRVIPDMSEHSPEVWTADPQEK